MYHSVSLHACQQSLGLVFSVLCVCTSLSLCTCLSILSRVSATLCLTPVHQPSGSACVCLPLSGSLHACQQSLGLVLPVLCVRVSLSVLACPHRVWPLHCIPVPSISATRCPCCTRTTIAGSGIAPTHACAPVKDCLLRWPRVEPLSSIPSHPQHNVTYFSF